MEYSDKALSRLGQLTQLESLYLDGIDAPASLQLSPSLNALSLTGMQVDDAMAARIAACSDLKSLNLRSTAITDEGLRLIASGTKLTSLSLWETPLTDAGMAHLTTHPLRSIELRSMRLGDATFNHLARVKTLSRLTIWAGGPPRVSLSTIGDPNDQSPIVNPMTVGGMRVLKDLPQLRSLSLLAFPSYEDYLVLGELKQLRELSMMMSLTEEADLAALEAALPKTRISAGSGAGNVQFRVQDLGIAKYGPVFERIELGLAEIQQRHPNFKLELEGDAVWRWKNLYQIVIDLAASLGTAAIVIFFVLGIAYRSVRLGLISVIPNVFPLAVAGVWMVWSGYSLELVSVCAFTVCLGIAVDDTIHFLTRFVEERELTGDIDTAIRRAFGSAGVAMVRRLLFWSPASERWLSVTLATITSLPRWESSPSPPHSLAIWLSFPPCCPASLPAVMVQTNVNRSRETANSLLKKQ
jgi:hypothetical protein